MNFNNITILLESIQWKGGRGLRQEGGRGFVGNRSQARLLTTLKSLYTVGRFEGLNLSCRKSCSTSMDSAKRIEKAME